MGAGQFQRQQCWRPERISQVINKEAVSVDRASFLATHAPLNDIRYAGQTSSTSEDGFLNELVSRSANNLHTFAVVQGIPGTGKSHLIRWLKERYSASNAERHGDDVVLLIERAYSSLRGTLLQIIDSGVFDTEALTEQVEKLRGATETLSERALSDEILDHLKIATYEMHIREADRPPTRISQNLEEFLLDPVVRRQLKRPGGPIDRLVRFLSEGTASGLSRDEMPGFEPDDVKFPVDVLNEIKKDGNSHAKLLADALHLQASLRQQLARFLNHLLNYAVGHATRLTSDDLKQIFNDLRRQLRSQGRSLTLFIEDITAFTGIDAGLIDVLATQHTGEANREFCRLLSVVGVTDSYYHDRFPDNLKERITHRLTLNAQGTGQAQSRSELLETPEAAADLVARYLNAMRVSQDSLASWLHSGARLSTLPNACASCVYRAPCHASFGYIDLVPDHPTEDLRVGLYPFNPSAVWQMYQQLDPTKVSQTPRSLLTSIVEQVLQIHGPRLTDGRFPPPAKEMGSDIRAPRLAKPTQENIISQQGGGNAERIKSLVLFWGDGTVDARTISDRQEIGGLPEGVFTAFGLPMIHGEAMTGPAEGGSSITGRDSTSVVTESTIFDGASKAGATTTENPRDEKPKPVRSKLLEAIQAWHSDGRLRLHEQIIDWLGDQIAAAYDWEAHGISRSQVDEKIRRRWLAIDGQAGTFMPGALVFPRGQQLYMALLALVYLREDPWAPAPELTAIHLASLSAWLRASQERIINFVTQPVADEPVPAPLLEILLLDGLAWTCLAGELGPEHLAAGPLLRRVIADCQEGIPWDKRIVEAGESHSSVWVALMRRLDAARITEARGYLLQALNRPQGGSNSVRWIDAANALTAMERFLTKDWQWPTGKLPARTDDKVWLCAASLYNDLQDVFEPALVDDQRRLKEKLSKMRALLGKDSLEAVFKAIQQLLANLGRYQVAYYFQRRSELGASQLEIVYKRLDEVAIEQSRGRLALRLSAIAEDQRTLKEYLKYFDDFHELAQQQADQLEKRINQLRATTSDQVSVQTVEQEFLKVEKLIENMMGGAS
jgi:hypothetical protein